MDAVKVQTAASLDGRLFARWLFPMQRLRPRAWKWLWQSYAIFPFVIAPAYVVLLVFIIPDDISPAYSEQVKACDRAVDALLNSRDLVEVQRAGILIENLDCSAAKRLTRP